MSRLYGAAARNRRETAGLFQQSEGIARTGGSHTRGGGVVYEGGGGHMREYIGRRTSSAGPSATAPAYNEGTC